MHWEKWNRMDCFPFSTQIVFCVVYIFYEELRVAFFWKYHIKKRLKNGIDYFPFSLQISEKLGIGFFRISILRNH